MRNTTKSQNTFPPPLPFFLGSTSLLDSRPPPPEQCRGTENGGCGQLIPCYLCRSLSPPAPVWRPSHGRQSSTNCPSVRPLHRARSVRNRLLQHGYPMGSQALPANLLLRGLLSPRVCRSWLQEPAPGWAPHGIHPTAWGPSIGCRGSGCLTMAFITGCRGVSAPVPGAPPPPPSSLILVSAESFLSRSLTPLFQLLFWSRFFFPLLKYVITEALPPLLRQPLAKAELMGHGGSFWHLLTEATPVAPPLLKPCHINPIHCPMT